MVARLPLLGWPPGGDQPGHSDLLADQTASVSVRDVGVSEHVEDLIKQPCPVRLGFGAVDQTLGQLVAGSGIRASQRLVEKLHQLVEHLGVGLGQRREQHGMAALDVGALQRLIG